MKAKIQAKVNDTERQRLEDVLPLETPFTLALEPTNACNIRCAFCYHADIDAIRKANVKFGYMDWELFKKIIDDVALMPQRLKRLKIGGMGEPLLHKDLPKMIEYAKKRNVAERIDLFTNGLLLTPQLNKDLVNAGLDWINISVNGVDAKEYRKKCSCNLDMERYQENIRHLYQHRDHLFLYIKLGDDGYTEEEKQQFYQMFGDICNEIYIETIVDNIWPGTQLNVKKSEKDYFGEPLQKKEVCALIFIQLMINWNGKAILCGADWKGAYPFGDASKQTVSEIWNGETLRKIRVLQLKKEKDTIELCKGCTRHWVCIPDNIDPYAEELLRKYEGIR